MMNKSPRPHLLFILETLSVIEQHTPKTKKAFLLDRNAQDASLMRLQDIGEQLSRLRNSFSDYFEEHHTDSWYKLIGLRNIISHGYRQIEFEIIWEVLINRLPPFREEIEALLQI